MVDDSDFRPQHICLESTYCGLCRFDLGLKETIVMLTEDGLSSPPFRRNLGITFGNRKFHAPVHQCTGAHEFARGCHEKCLEFDRRLAAGPLSADFLRATDYRFPAPKSSQEGRRAFIQTRLASNVSRVCPLLPPELCEVVAKHLVRECAVASLRLLPRSLDASYRVSMSRNIYATFIAIDGIRYIETLSNTKDSDKAQLVWVGTSSEADDIYVAEDHWGLRGLLPSRKAVPAVVKAGAWWRKLSPSSRILRADTDGWKTRYLVDAEADGPLGPAWSSSPPPPGIGELRFRRLDRLPTPLESSDMRLTALQVNDADIVGYSACLHAANILTLRSHIRGEPPPLSFYEDVDHLGLVWLYMPVARDERISEIRLRERGKVINQTSGPALMLVSDKNRAIMIGPYLSPKLKPSRPWVLLSRLRGRRSNLVFNTASGLDVGGSDVVTAVACSDGHLSPTPECGYHPSQVPSSPAPSWLQFSWGYFTSAPLGNVVRLTTCQTGSGRTLSIIGLLLEYADGSCGCVGQYRYDGVLRRLDVGDAPALRIGLSKPRLGRSRHVVEVAVGQPRGDSGSMWLELPWCRRIDWWVGPDQVEIHHGSQEKPL